MCAGAVLWPLKNGVGQVQLGSGSACNCPYDAGQFVHPFPQHQSGHRGVRPSQQAGQSADFINCIAWRQAADFLANYASKGTIVSVEGRIQTRSYDGQNGKVYVTEVVADNVQIISNRNANTNQSNTYNNQTFTPSVEPSYDDSMDDDFSNTPSLDISSDDLPFY